MHYLDPARPRISGLPAFRTELNPTGLSIIPGLHCAPREGDRIEISGFFSTGRNSCARREIIIAAADFASFWERWLSDPESVAESDFNWKPLPTQPALQSKPVLSLDDLLGDFS
jgi:hypothetical protein